jgi:dTDP-4-dehydrorhamnose 3,5-epimerase
VKFHETALAGAFIVEPDPMTDERGSFARIVCQREFEARGLPGLFVQSSVSTNLCAGTLRGLHMRTAPSAEAKLVRCIAGRLADVIVDLRPESATFRRHEIVELDAATLRALLVPEGFAHGFVTLQDHTVVLYQMTEFYEPGGESGIRFDDPELAISWPRPPAMMSARDAAFPTLAKGPWGNGDS